MDTQVIFVRSNVSRCFSCGTPVSSKLKLAAHINNNRLCSKKKEVDDLFFCYCEEFIPYHEVKDHVQLCFYFGDFACTHHETVLHFKSYDTARNHMISAHLAAEKGLYKDEFLWASRVEGTQTFRCEDMKNCHCDPDESVTLALSSDGFERVRPDPLLAQIGVRFEHMQVQQLRDKMRNNKTKRLILKQLIIESDFFSENSKFLQICGNVIPAYDKHDRLMKRYKIFIADRTIEVVINLAEIDGHIIWQRTLPYLILEAHMFSRFMPTLTMNHVHEHVHQIGQIDERVLNAIASLTRFLESYSVNFYGIRIVTQLLLLGYQIAQYGAENKGLCMALILNFLMNFHLPFALIQRVQRSLTRHIASFLRFLFPQIEREDNLRAHVGEDVITSIVTVIGTITSVLVMKDLPSMPKIAELVNSVKKMGDFSRAVNNSWTLVEKVTSACVSHVYEWIFGYPSHIGELKECLVDIDKWYIEIHEMTGLTLLEDIDTHSPLCVKIEDLYKRGLRFAQQIQHYKLEQKLVSAFHVHMRTISSYYDKANASGAFRSGPRIEPLTIMMHGDSGVGKTTVVYAIAIDLLKLHGPINDGDWSSDIYVRNQEDVYYDGYTGQRCVLVDDFGQMKDSQANPNLEFMELIRVGNSAPWHLHMAELAEKKNTFFKSTLYLMTSNLDRFQPESLSCPEAVRRRFDVCARVYNKPEYTMECGYKKRRVDPTKIQEHFNGETSLEIYLFQLTDGDGNDLAKAPMTYDEFRDYCRQKYRERHSKSTKQHKFLDKLVKADYAPHPDDDLLAAHIDVISHAATYMNSTGSNIIMRNHKDVFAEWGDPQIIDFLNYGFLMFQNIFTQEYHDAISSLIPTLGMRESLTDEQRDQFMFAADIENIYSENHQLYLKNHIERAQRSPNYNLENYLYFPKQFIENIPIDGMARVAPTIQAVLEQRSDQAALRRTADEAREETRSFLQKVGDMIVRNKDFILFVSIYSAIAGFAAVIGGIVGEKLLGETIFDYNHTGLILGEVTTHSHMCNGCGKKYTHTHTIKDPKISRKYGQKCEDCRVSAIPYLMVRLRDGQLVRAEEIYKWEDDWLASIDESIMNDDFLREQITECEKCFCFHHPYLDCALHSSNIYAELSSSGDPKTMTKKQARVELSASGDPVTLKKGQARTELSTSGDPVTNTKPAIRVEMSKISDSKEQIERLNALIGAYCREKDIVPEVVQAELRTDPNAESLSDKVANNLYQIDVKIDGLYGHKVLLCMIHGKVGLTVAHLKPYIDKGTHVKLTNMNIPDGFEFETSRLKMSIVPDKDQMLIAFPTGMMDHQSLLKNIVTPETLSTFRTTRGVLIGFNDKRVKARYGDVEAEDYPREYEDPTMQQKFMIRDRYKYTNMETGPGDCGAVLVAVNSKIQYKILGIHVCGASSLGLASPLNVTQIQEAMTKLPIAAHIGLDLDKYVEKTLTRETCKLPEGNFVPIGKCSIPVYGATRTQIIPSLVYGQVADVITRPSHLAPFEVDGKTINPMYIGIAKAGPITPEPDEQLLQMAINDMSQKINCKIKEKNRRVLSNIESVMGVEGDEFLAPIKRQTSPGFPWVAQRRKLGKTQWLGSDQTYFLDPLLEKEMEARILAARQGDRYPTIWIDTLKDERRPLEKVYAGKTRVFSAGPMDYTLVFRKYFLGFAAHCSENRNYNEISVGTNVYSQDWSNIAHLMKSRGRCLIAGDFTNFDGTLVARVLEKILTIIQDFYDDENFIIRQILWKEIINSVHLCGDQIYLWTHSQPSGCPITAILNSIYNSVTIRYIWLSITQNTPYFGMGSFFEHVCMVSYGDDNLINVSNEAIVFFNQNTIAVEYKAKLGMTYTDENKSANALPYKTLEEVSYLKRRFVFDPKFQTWLAPLTLDTVLEMVNWVRSELDMEDRTRENIETSAFELSLHDEEVFTKWTNIYKKVSRNFSVRPRILTYQEYRAIELVKYGYIDANVKPDLGALTQSPYLQDTVEVQQITTFKDDSQVFDYLKPSPMNPGSWTGIGEESATHSIQSILSRPVRVARFQLATATVFPILKFPDVIMQSNPNILDKLNYFTYFRANVKIRITFNSTPFISGRYWAYFSPFEGNTNRSWSTLPHVTGYPGIEFDLASNSPVEIKIPYCAPLSHYNLINTFSNMGTLKIVALNAIAAGTTPAPTIYVTIFAWFEDIHLSLPTSVPAKLPLLAHVGNEQAATVSGTLAKISQGADLIGSLVPKIEPFAKQASWATKLASGMASSMGFCKPTDMSTNTVVSNVPAKGYTNSDGIDQSVKLGLCRDNEVIEIPGIYSTDVDEMNLSYVCSKSCLFRVGIPWVAGDAADKILYEFPVSPGISMKTGSIIHPTTLAYISSMFLYWRGGLRFRITTAKTAFHSGRLRITYHPGVFDSTITPTPIFENAYNWILDLTISSEISFDIPYISNTPHREVLVDAPDSTSFAEDRFSSGIVTISVLNELRVANSSAASTVPLNFWISGDSDISFSVPTLKHIPTSPDTVEVVAKTVSKETEELKDKLVAHVFNDVSSGLSHNEQVSPDGFPMFPKSPMHDFMPEQMVIGERITSLRQLIKRFCFTAYGNTDPYPTFPTVTGKYFAVAGPMGLPAVDTSLYSILAIDPAYLGEITSGDETRQLVSLPTSVDSSGVTGNVLPCHAMSTFSPQHPLYYLSYLYRFHRGSRKYKLIIGPNQMPMMGSAADVPQIGSSTFVRTSLPFYVIVSRTTSTNAVVTRPTLTTPSSVYAVGERNSGRLESVHYPDINGVIEFETPFYTNLPIHINAEGTVPDAEGPLIRRNRIIIKKGFVSQDLWQPANNFTADGYVNDAVYVQQFGSFKLLEAAGDDFSFGYLIGAPSIILF